MFAQNYHKFQIDSNGCGFIRKTVTMLRKTQLCVSNFPDMINHLSGENAFKFHPGKGQFWKWEGWVYSRDFGVLAYRAKGSAFCCTISQCLSALSQNNWCQPYMVYMPILGHSCQGGGRTVERELKPSFTKCFADYCVFLQLFTSRALWWPRLWLGHWAEMGDKDRAEMKYWMTVQIHNI